MVRDTGLNTYHIPCMEPKITDRGHWEWGAQDEVRKLDNQMVNPGGDLPRFIRNLGKDTLQPTDNVLAYYVDLNVPAISTIDEVDIKELVCILVESHRELVKKIQEHEDWIKSLMLRINYKLDS